MQWREKAISAGAQPTPVIDRFYFRSIYFREPSGVLFEIATLGPRLHRRRAARAPRREALAAARLRAPAGRGRAEPETGEEPAHAPGGVSGDFIWRDAGRTVVFRQDGYAGAPTVFRETASPFRAAEHAAGAGRPPRTGRGRRRGARGRAGWRSGGSRGAPRFGSLAAPGRPRRRPRDRHRQGGRLGQRRPGRGDPDHDVGRRDDRHPPPARRAEPGSAAWFGRRW